MVDGLMPVPGSCLGSWCVREPSATTSSPGGGGGSRTGCPGRSRGGTRRTCTRTHTDARRRTETHTDVHGTRDHRRPVTDPRLGSSPESGALTHRCDGRDRGLHLQPQVPSVVARESPTVSEVNVLGGGRWVCRAKRGPVLRLVTKIPPVRIPRAISHRIERRGVLRVSRLSQGTRPHSGSRSGWGPSAALSPRPGTPSGR